MGKRKQKTKLKRTNGKPCKQGACNLVDLWLPTI